MIKMILGTRQKEGVPILNKVNKQVEVESKPIKAQNIPERMRMTPER